jgi:formiminotetrahydrofolate cyclodeaminase
MRGRWRAITDVVHGIGLSNCILARRQVNISINLNSLKNTILFLSINKDYQ